MAAAVALKNAGPYASRLGETYLDLTPQPPVEVTITIKLVGTVAQIQADWATYAAATATATSATITHSGQ